MKNKIIFITGASSGIGEACAEIFASHGAHLILSARRQDRLQTLAEKLSKQHQIKTFCLNLDVSDKKAVSKIPQQLPKEWQPVDVLINSAGLALGLDKISEGNFDDWEQMIDVNLKGLLYVTRTLLPSMIERKQGQIINISSISGRQTYSGGGVYCATKHAVNAITDVLKKETLGTNIRISSVEPGAVETEFSEVRFKGDKTKAKKVYEGYTPLSAKDIADAVYYCAACPPHVNIREILILPTASAGMGQTYKEK